MRIGFIAAACAASLSLGACGTDVVPEKQASEVRAVSIAQVALRPIAGSFEAAGLLVSREEAAVGSELSGFKVASVLVEEGAYVKQGEPLARLDAALLRAKIAQARANVEQARAQAAQAQGEAARVRGLDGTGILSDEQIDSRRFQARSAQASVEVARAALNDLLTQESRMVIRAPVSGIVLERTVRPGDIASPGQPMFRIARGSMIELAAEVPEDQLAVVKVGQPASVTLPSGTSIVGQVRLVSPRIDPQTKLGEVRVRLPAHPELRAGGFGRARFEGAAIPVPAVPERAVQFEASGPQIVIVTKQNRADRVAVKTGERADGFVELVEGPPVGTRVALGGGAFLLDGDPVKPVVAKPKPAQQTAAGGDRS